MNLEMIIYVNVLIMFIILILLMMIERFKSYNPVGEWCLADWMINLFLSIIWPIGVYFISSVFLPSFFTFIGRELTKERGL